ncbi:MAG: class B sortase [Oscillospiraceae bacterium]|nr:class B sortase [Oscillospiraceae bacterium]
MENTEKKTKEPKSDKRGRRLFDKRYIPYICLIAVGVFLVTAGLRDIIMNRIEAAAARGEYTQLYDIFRGRTGNQGSNQSPPPTTAGSDSSEQQGDGTEEISKDAEGNLPSLDELYKLNNDFIGWFSIENLIEYPVVRGRNNSKYINTTFLGERNASGAIFMDYRHTGGWDEIVSIIYGHNMKDDSMFAQLARYLDETFMQQNRTILVTTRDGRQLTYEIFAVKQTDAWDSAYTIAISNRERAAELLPNAPQNASHFILLSTCTRSANPDERIIVFAALVD